ncbi:cytochrome P450 1A2-like [Mya arenaria]|uniref:cytochrome P450 1A2-like n=1 Tax=Mya arenaria TaxID=6604 RepID=UPI0022E32236|nr:cytochrome P450 1A2-like [Mya arenaria]
MCLNSFRAIKLALAGEDYKRHMNDRAPTFFAERFLYGSQSVVFWQDGFSPVHGEMRKVINGCFHFYGEDGRDRFERRIGLELQRLDRQLQALGDGEIEVVDLLRHSVANTICIALTGEAFKEDDPGIDMIWDFIEGTNFFVLPVTNFLMASFPFLRFVPGEHKTVYDRQEAAKSRIIQDFFTEHKKGRTPGNPRGIVDQLLDSQEVDINQGKSPLFTDERIHSAILETFNAVSRECNKDLEFEGYDVPKKTTVMANVWFVHHDEDIWGDPWKFRPERFLDQDGQILPRHHPLRINWIPFGYARRSCLGEPFARARYFLYMAHLLRRWEFIPVPGKMGSCDPRKLKDFDNKITIRPQPFYCKVRRLNQI